MQRRWHPVLTPQLLGQLLVWPLLWHLRMMGAAALSQPPCKRATTHKLESTPFRGLRLDSRACPSTIKGCLYMYGERRFYCWCMRGLTKGTLDALSL